MVDGLFGIGLNRLLTQEWIQRISFLNQIKAYKIAIDIPSGIHGDYGNAMGAYLFCDICYAIQFKKTGHFLNDGIDSYQQIETVDIGEKNLFEDVIYLKNEQDYGDFLKNVYIIQIREVMENVLLLVEVKHYLERLYYLHWPMLL